MKPVQSPRLQSPSPRAPDASGTLESASESVSGQQKIHGLQSPTDEQATQDARDEQTKRNPINVNNLQEIKETSLMVQELGNQQGSEAMG